MTHSHVEYLWPLALIALGVRGLFTPRPISGEEGMVYVVLVLAGILWLAGLWRA